MRARAERGSRAWRCAASGLIALAAALAPAPARADDSQQFELLKGLFYAGQYDDVVRRLAILLDPSNPACSTVEGAPTAPQTCHLVDAVLIERSREMQAIALFALKRQAEADGIIEKMLRQNPAYSPEPGSVPQTVVERVREIKARLQKELEDKARKDADEQRKALLARQKAAEDERRWIAELTKLASEERIVERRSRLLAFVPFGVGQFQNGDMGLGIFFAASQVLAAGTSIGLGAAHAFNAAPEPGRKVDATTLNNQIQILAIGNQIAFGAWAALAIAGIVQANVAFVPEVVTVRQRQIPKRPAPLVIPTVGASPQALSLGVVGTF